MVVKNIVRVIFKPTHMHNNSLATFISLYTLMILYHKKTKIEIRIHYLWSMILVLYNIVWWYGYQMYYYWITKYYEIYVEHERTKYKIEYRI